MINKEKIEEYKETLEDLTKDENVYNSIKRAVNGTFEYIQQLETKQQKVIDRLQHDNEIDNIAVKKLEEKRRTATSEYYKNSYQMQIHKLNAKIEVRKEMLEILKGEK